VALLKRRSDLLLYLRLEIKVTVYFADSVMLSGNGIVIYGGKVLPWPLPLFSVLCLLLCFFTFRFLSLSPLHVPREAFYYTLCPPPGGFRQYQRTFFEPILHPVVVSRWNEVRTVLFATGVSRLVLVSDAVGGFYCLYSLWDGVQDRESWTVQFRPSHIGCWGGVRGSWPIFVKGSLRD